MGKIIFDLSFFFLFLVFICFLPGRAFLYFRKIDLSIIETFTLSVLLGLLLFNLLNLLWGAIGLSGATYFVILLIDGIFIVRRLCRPTGITVCLRPKWTKENRMFLVVLFLGILSQIYLWQDLGMAIMLLPLILGLSVFTLVRRLTHGEGKAVGATILSYLALDLISLI